jgi:peptidoglycan/xylan/chitin deacetylase (PgdA/CDA1 family)
VIIPLAVAGATAAVAAAVHGTLHRNSPVFGAVLGRLRGPGRRVALTFDDGPNPDATPRILDVLAAEGVRATFFLLGKHVERWPEIARRVAAEGHVVANHGYHHRKLHLRSAAYIDLDVALGTESIAAATGVTPTLFRAPHGFRNPWVTRSARRRGQSVVGWTLGVWDSDKPGAAAISKRALEGARAGTILLLHDGDGYDPGGDRSQTVEALPAIIQGLRATGYSLVTP